MPVNVAQLVVSVGANTAMAEQGLMGLARMLGASGPLAVGAVGLGVVMAGVVAGSVDMAAKYQTQLTQLVTGAGESQANLKMVSDGILQMARDTGTSTKQLTDGMYMIESAGIHGAAGLKVLQAAAEGAKVGNADLGTVADAVTTILKNYPDAVNGADGATNALIATVASGKTHMQDLATALSSVLPAAQAAGIGLNDVLAAMAAQTAAGVPAADAATHLRQLMIALVAPSSAGAKAIEAVGLSTDAVAAEMKKNLPDAIAMIQQAMAKTYGEGSPKYVEAMKNISGGMREMQGMMLLASKTGMADFQTDLTTITGKVNTGGDAIAGWNLVQGTFNLQMSRLGQIFNTLMIQLGTNFLPVLTQLAKLLADALAPATKAVATPAAALSDTMREVSAHVSGLVEPLRGIQRAFVTLTPPVNTVGGAMRAMSGGVKTLSGEWHGLIKPVNDLAAPLAYLRGAWAAVGLAMQQASQTLSGDTQPILQQLHDFFVQQLLPAVTQFTYFASQTLIPMFAQVADFINKNVIPVLIQLAGWFLRNILPAVESLMSFFKQTVLPILEQFWTMIAKNVIPVIENVAHTILTKWMPPLERIAADLLPALNPLLQFMGLLFQNVIGPALSTAADDIGGLLNGLADLLDGIKNFVNNPNVTTMTNLFKSMGNAGIGIGNFMTWGAMSHLPHFAEGGVMANTGFALVGEQGPELVTLPGGAQITPIANSSGVSGTLGLPPGYGGYGGSGGMTITINHTTTLDGRVVARQVVKYLPSEIRLATGGRSL